MGRSERAAQRSRSNRRLAPHLRRGVHVFRRQLRVQLLQLRRGCGLRGVALRLGPASERVSARARRPARLLGARAGRTAWPPWSPCPGGPSRRSTAGAAARSRPPANAPAQQRSTCPSWWRASEASPAAPCRPPACRTPPSGPAARGGGVSRRGTALPGPRGAAAHLRRYRARVHRAQHCSSGWRLHGAAKARQRLGAAAKCVGTETAGKRNRLVQLRRATWP